MLSAAHIDIGAIQRKARQIAGVLSVGSLRELIGSNHFPYGIFTEGQRKISKVSGIVRPGFQMAAVLKGGCYGGICCSRPYVALYVRGIIHGDCAVIPSASGGVKRINALAGVRGGRDGSCALQGDIARNAISTNCTGSTGNCCYIASRHFDGCLLVVSGWRIVIIGSDAIGCIAGHEYLRFGIAIPVVNGTGVI